VCGSRRVTSGCPGPFAVLQLSELRTTYGTPGVKINISRTAKVAVRIPSSPVDMSVRAGTPDSLQLSRTGHLIPDGGHSYAARIVLTSPQAMLGANAAG
jgi:hypothetical protein